MHTAPHPTLGELEASLLGSKGLFQRCFEEGDSMAPWKCPKPTNLPAWRSLCPSPLLRDSRISSPFSFPQPTTQRLQDHKRSQIHPNAPKKRVKSAAHSPLLPSSKPQKQRTHHSSITQPPPQLLPSKGRHRGPIQLRSCTLRLLRHSDVSTAPTEQSSRKASLLYRSCI
jgi:hypothetical protein